MQRKIIERIYGEPESQREALLGGIDFNVQKVTLKSGRQIVLRSGKDYHTSGNRLLRIGQLFLWEKFFYENARNKIGVEVPTGVHVFEAKSEEDESIMLYDYLPGKTLDEVYGTLNQDEQRNIRQQLGTICAKIHNIEPVVSVKNEFFRTTEWAIYIANRIRERLSSLVPLSLFDESLVHKIYLLSCDVFKRIERKNFLHLDLRFNNLITKDKTIYGLIDTENFELGDPYFELARMDVYGLLDDDFLKGYRSINSETKIDFESIPFQLYRLETICLLIGVFAFEVSDLDMKRSLEVKLFEVLEMIVSHSCVI